MEAATKNLPEDSRAWFLRGYGHRILGSWPAAEDHLTQALNKRRIDDEQVAATYLHRSRVRFEMAKDIGDDLKACSKLPGAADDFKSMFELHRYVRNLSEVNTLREDLTKVTQKRCKQILDLPKP